jgi:ribosomal-protein-alanine N-acetyltransferase
MSCFLPEIIDTSRLRLRSPVATDAPEIFKSYAQDLEVCRFMIWKPHPSESVTRDFINSCIEARKSGNRWPYVITIHGSDAAIGMIDAGAKGTTAIIGYVLSRTHWGKGFMPEAIESLTKCMLSESGIFRVQASCDVDNIASQRALEKSGFTCEGRLERHSVHPNISAEPRASFMYAKCR